MSDAEKKDEEVIFSAALEFKDQSERKAYLATACGEDKELRSKVEGLLKAHEAESLLDSPVVDLGVTLGDHPVSEGVGTVIGRYKLLERIGEGGMAVVYMAEQERPIRRKVALKVIKLGMDTKQVIGRFDLERQALAMMDHPNIAKVLDAGATETGRPYFVMELVKGVSITEYCDKNRLSTKERLDLFIQVCHAVQHAHQKGIIHRDIKPANVLVTMHDGKAVPKMIDFGIAKATNQRLTEKTLFTRYAQMIGTPAYMSPEQAEMSDLGVDTRTDIYSLGVLLYELLTGATPFSDQELRKAGYLEIQRIISKQEPPKPSTKLSTLGDTLTEVAQARKCEPHVLRKQVSGDLDWVVMKTLEKDRARRYETPNELANDIERHLRDEPVVAGPPSAVYRMRKFIRRNRTAVAVVLAILAAIVIGLSLATVGFVQASRQRDRAVVAEAEAVTQRNTAEQAREEEATARAKAEQAESVAQDQRRHSDSLLAKAIFEKGIRLLNEDSALGLLDLLDAYKGAAENPGLRDSIGRMWSIAHDLWSEQLVHVLPSGSNMTISPDGSPNMAISPDGRLLAVCSRNTVQLWDAATGQFYGETMELGKRIGAVLFSPDGKLLATHCVEGVSQLWDTATGQPVGPILQHNVDIQKRKMEDWDVSKTAWLTAFSPDGKLLATGYLDGTVRLWNTTTGQPYGEALQHDQVRAIAFSPDSELIATGSRDKTTRLWKVANLQPHVPPLRSGDFAENVLFSPDGKLLATKENSVFTISLWNTETGQLYKKLKHNKRMSEMKFSPDGKLLATASWDWAAQIWDVATGKLHSQRPHDGLVGEVAFSPDGRLLATGSADGTLRLWDVTNQKPYGKPMPFMGGKGIVAFSPDGKYLTTLSGAPRIWKTYQQLRTEVVAYQIGAELGAISSDGKVGAIISGNNVQLWDTTNTKALGKPLVHEGKVRSVAFSPDGKFLACGYGGWSLITRSADIGFVQLWEVSTGRPFGPALKAEYVSSLAFSPDGKLVADGLMGGQADIFVVATGQRIRTFNWRGWVQAVAFSPNGKVFATGLRSGIVQLWDITTGKQIGSPLKHRAGVVTMAFSPDGNLLATVSGIVDSNFLITFSVSGSGDEEQTVRIWDISTDPPYQSLALPPLAVRGKEVLNSFSTDGTILVSKHAEDAARIWRLPKPPNDFHTMQLLTWVAIGAQRDDNGYVTSIPWSQWQQQREELYASSMVEPRSGEYYEVPLSSERDLDEQERRILENFKIQASVLDLKHLDTSNSLYEFALLQLYTSDIEGYHETCNQMFERFSKSEEPDTASWVVWTCVLGPNAFEDLGQAVSLAEQLVESDNNNDKYLSTLGAILYRAGRFDEAVQQLTDLTDAWDQRRGFPTLTSSAYTWFFLAMAHHQLGNSDEAKSWFDKAVTRSEQEVADGPAWNRKLILHLFRTEAEELIKGEEVEK